MTEQEVAGLRLVAETKPFLDRGKFSELAAFLKGRWSPDCLQLLLDSADIGVLETAIKCLSLVGASSSCPALASLLHHERLSIVSAAEDALWAIWFRAGGTVGDAVLTRLARTVGEGRTRNVVPMLSELLAEMPTYAEAWHQRTQAYFLKGDYNAALRDARRAYNLNPHHFGALALLANAHVALGHHHEAFETYRGVLNLHPRMYGVRQAMGEVRRLLPVAQT